MLSVNLQNFVMFVMWAFIWMALNVNNACSIAILAKITQAVQNVQKIIRIIIMNASSIQIYVLLPNILMLQIS